MRLKIFLYITFLFSVCSCVTREIYSDDKYTIQLKPIVSYYQASPDLIVKTDSGDFKVNLNGFGKALIPQEKIGGVTLTKVTVDSLIIHFVADTSFKQAKEEWFYLNIPNAIDTAKKYKY